MTYKAIDIANYFISKSDDEAGEFISNLKLQKLLYYAQGFHLAVYNKPLFEESIQAWQHGPVVSEVYQKFKNYGSNAIPLPGIINLELDAKTREFLDEIYGTFGQFSAWKLRDMTHEEPPWRDVPKSSFSEIDHSALKSYFKTQLIES